MNTSPELSFANETEELLHWLSLSQIEMSLLGDSAYSLGRTLKIPVPVERCRELLPFKRGKTVVVDFEKLGQHCLRIAVLLRKLEAEQTQPSVLEPTAQEGDALPEVTQQRVGDEVI